MPRLYDGAGNRLDFCYQHFPSEANALRMYGGEHFSYNEVHPDYMKENLNCTVCGCRLTRIDNLKGAEPEPPPAEPVQLEFAELARRWRLERLEHLPITNAQQRIEAAKEGVLDAEQRCNEAIEKLEKLEERIVIAEDYVRNLEAYADRRANDPAGRGFKPVRETVEGFEPEAAEELVKLHEKMRREGTEKAVEGLDTQELINLANKANRRFYHYAPDFARLRWDGADPHPAACHWIAHTMLHTLRKRAGLDAYNKETARPKCDCGSGHYSYEQRNEEGDVIYRACDECKEKQFYDSPKCDCGSGEFSDWVRDAYNIPLCRACNECREWKLSDDYWPMCECGSNLHAEWVRDSQNIPICLACDKCRKRILSQFEQERRSRFGQSAKSVYEQLPEQH
jgi:hypothetical protein